MNGLPVTVTYVLKRILNIGFMIMRKFVIPCDNQQIELMQHTHDWRQPYIQKGNINDT